MNETLDNELTYRMAEQVPTVVAAPKAQQATTRHGGA